MLIVKAPISDPELIAKIEAEWAEQYPETFYDRDYHSEPDTLDGPADDPVEHLLDTLDNGPAPTTEAESL